MPVMLSESSVRARQRRRRSLEHREHQSFSWSLFFIAILHFTVWSCSSSLLAVDPITAAPVTTQYSSSSATTHAPSFAFNSFAPTSFHSNLQASFAPATTPSVFIPSLIVTATVTPLPFEFTTFSSPLLYSSASSTPFSGADSFLQSYFLSNANFARGFASVFSLTVTSLTSLITTLLIPAVVIALFSIHNHAVEPVSPSCSLEGDHTAELEASSSSTTSPHSSSSSAASFAILISSQTEEKPAAGVA